MEQVFPSTPLCSTAEATEASTASMIFRSIPTNGMEESKMEYGIELTQQGASISLPAANLLAASSRSPDVCWSWSLTVVFASEVAQHTRVTKNQPENQQPQKHDVVPGTDAGEIEYLDLVWNSMDRQNGYTGWGLSMEAKKQFEKARIVGEPHQFFMEKHGQFRTPQ